MEEIFLNIQGGQMSEQQTRKMDFGDKLLLLGNLATIFGIGMVSAGSVLRVLKNGELPDQPVFATTTTATERQATGSYRGDTGYFQNYR